MSTLIYTVKKIDSFNYYVGQGVKWLLLLVTLLSATNAITRKVFDLTSNGMLEAQWYLYAAVFLLGGAYALQKNSHVRIDFISAKIGAKGRNIIDLIGFLFILSPFCFFMIYLSWGYFTSAFYSGEMSSNAGGLIRWPVYLLVPVGFYFLLIQNFVEIIKRILFLKGLSNDPLEEMEQND